MQDRRTLRYSSAQRWFSTLWVVFALPVGMGLIAGAVPLFAPDIAVPVAFAYGIGCALHAFNVGRILYFERPFGATFEVSHEGVSRSDSGGKQQAGRWCDLESIEGLSWIRWGWVGYLCWVAALLSGLSWPVTLRFRDGGHVRIPMKGVPALGMRVFFWPMADHASVHGLPEPFVKVTKFAVSVWAPTPWRRIAYYGAAGCTGVAAVGLVAVAFGQQLDGRTLLGYGAAVGGILTGTTVVAVSIWSERTRK